MGREVRGIGQEGCCLGQILIKVPYPQQKEPLIRAVFLCMPSYLAICLAVVARRHAGDLVEGLVEIAGAVVARADGDLRDGQCRVDE